MLKIVGLLNSWRERHHAVVNNSKSDNILNSFVKVRIKPSTRMFQCDKASVLYDGTLMKLSEDVHETSLLHSGGWSRRSCGYSCLASSRLVLANSIRVSSRLRSRLGSTRLEEGTIGASS